ncbi:YhfG family protein [Nitrincola sp. MINF-07-Sa-05]|uniref:YhfG family protein n=1 Tax=Nitrincola salilacus TaxID=3400273 RepID=UPI003917BA8C
MKETELQAKKAYCAKKRRSNYFASLRLEGFDTKPTDVFNELPSREAVLASYMQRRR